jgi:hypothetical protein
MPSAPVGPVRRVNVSQGGGVGVVVLVVVLAATVATGTGEVVAFWAAGAR